MATHKSAEKRARQSVKRRARNNQRRSQIHTAERAVKDAKTPTDAEAALKTAFSIIQKSRSVLHINAIKRKMSRLAKAAARLKKAS